MRLPKCACKPGKTLNPSCMVFRNEQLLSILWIAQCFLKKRQGRITLGSVLSCEIRDVSCPASCGVLYISCTLCQRGGDGKKSFPHVIWCGASSISIRKVSMGVSPINLKKKRCSRHFRPMERRAGRRSNSLANLFMKQWMSMFELAQCNT